MGGLFVRCSLMGGHFVRCFLMGSFFVRCFFMRCPAVSRLPMGNGECIVRPRVVRMRFAADWTNAWRYIAIL